MSEPQAKPAAKMPPVTVVSGPKRPMGRFPLILATVGAVIALLAGGLYLTRATEPPPLTPEESAREFLSAVFLANSPDRVAAVVCASWNPTEAIERTSDEISRSVRVSWDEFRVVTSDEQRVTLRVRLGLRLPDDLRPTSYAQWRIHLVNEGGWRVCEARPFVT